MAVCDGDRSLAMALGPSPPGGDEQPRSTCGRGIDLAGRIGRSCLTPDGRSCPANLLCKSDRARGRSHHTHPIAGLLSQPANHSAAAALRRSIPLDIYLAQVPQIHDGLLSS
jgi:hypothetical protein